MVFQHKRPPTKTAFSSLQGRWFGSHSVRKKCTNQRDRWAAALRALSREKSEAGGGTQAPWVLGDSGKGAPFPRTPTPGSAQERP